MLYILLTVWKQTRLWTWTMITVSLFDIHAFNLHIHSVCQETKLPNRSIYHCFNPKILSYKHNYLNQIAELYIDRVNNLKLLGFPCGSPWSHIWGLLLFSEDNIIKMYILRFEFYFSVRYKQWTFTSLPNKVINIKFAETFIVWNAPPCMYDYQKLGVINPTLLYPRWLSSSSPC